MNKKIPIFLSVWLFCQCFVFSQQSLDWAAMKPVNQATLFGIGKSFLYDSYLSPVEYDGVGLSLLHDRMNRTSLFNENLLMQQQFHMQVAITKNPSASASEYYGNLYYHLLGLYPIIQTSNFRLLGGGGGDASLGGIYNVRNSNNPGSLKASVNVNASAMVTYNWRIFTFRWQLTTPLLGAFFSPEYGHSYYEIFTLGNNKGTIHLGSLHNQLALRNYFTADIPLERITFRAGYLGNYYRTDVNELVTKIVSHQFMVGFAVESLNFGGQKARRNQWLNSVYY